jgi:Protein of unknown function (DUF3147)
MSIKVTYDPAALRETNWREISIRFLFGGLITVATGLIAKEYGPALGGLFMAFPAIFPASATLVAKHEDTEMERAGLRGERRAARAAALDARGTAMGTVGLMAFAMIAWQLLPAHRTALVLLGATMVWFCVAVAIWWLRKALSTSRWARHRRKARHGGADAV